MSLLTHLYRFAVRQYPTVWRAEFDGEMQEIFRPTLVAAASRGRAALAVLCWRAWRYWPAALVQAHQLDHAQERRRRHFRRKGWWIGATALGRALSLRVNLPRLAGLGGVLNAASGRSDEITAALSAALRGGLVGPPPWWALRRWVPPWPAAMARA